jgi:hypothetical protein
MWDAAFLWYLLDTLSQPGHAEFFHHHRDDPGYAEWRAQANRLAGQDPLLRDKLAALDVRLEGLRDEPRSPDYLPPDTPAEVALATEPGERDSDSGWGSLLLLGLVGIVLYSGWRRLFIGWRPREAGGSTPVQGGASPDRGRSDKSYTPRWFRVGMTLPVDPAPFILAADTTHVRAPEAATRSGLLSIETVSEVETDGARWHRLYLPGGHDFFQAHLDDRISPTSAAISLCSMRSRRLPRRNGRSGSTRRKGRSAGRNSRPKTARPTPVFGRQATPALPRANLEKR